MNNSLPVAATRAYFPALTGLRAVAAFAVFAVHYNPFPTAGPGWRPLANRFVGELHSGVTIFFVLSGFLICYRYYDAVAQRPAGWLPRYFWNRFARIYPLYFLVTALTFALFLVNPARYDPSYHALAPATGWHQLGRWLLNVTLLKSFLNRDELSGLAQGWSLTVEECFYAGAPWFMLLFRRSRWAGVWLSVGCLLLGLGLGATVGRLPWLGLFSGLTFNLNYTFPGRCVEFFAGMALAVRVRARPPGAPGRGSFYTAAGGGLLLACLLAMAALHEPGGDTSKDQLGGILLNNLGIAAAVCLLLNGLLREATWLRALLSTRLLGLLGRSSYAFYLIHLGVVSILLRTYVTDNPVRLFLLLNVLAVLLYQGVERPLYRRIRQWADRKTPAG